MVPVSPPTPRPDSAPHAVAFHLVTQGKGKVNDEIIGSILGEFDWAMANQLAGLKTSCAFTGTIKQYNYPTTHWEFHIKEMVAQLSKVPKDKEDKGDRVVADRCFAYLELDEDAGGKKSRKK